MKKNKTKLKDLLLIEPDIFLDNRGYFFESYNKIKLDMPNIQFIQDNESKSAKGVLRGLHFQAPPFDQTKLVRCVLGEILDVAVDLRHNSETFAKYDSFILSGNNKKQLFIPKGFAHGFFVLSEYAIVNYKVDNFYSKNHEMGIIWNDKNLNIDWKLNGINPIISKKDMQLMSFSKKFFKNENFGNWG